MAVYTDGYENEGLEELNDKPKKSAEPVIGLEGETEVRNIVSNKDLFPITEQEKGYGMDLDIFGRFPPNKVPRGYGKPIYHYHAEPSVGDLKFIWNELKCKKLKVKHLDNSYTLCSFIGDEHHSSNYNIITRRYIWPLNYQNKMYESIPFEYNLEDINKYFKWAIILVHGGKFVIAIYHGMECLYHKTERAYVVRSRGKREINYASNKSKRNKGSAGTMKRNWNELHLKENINEILSSLQDSLQSCSRIFIHAPSTVNKLALFGTLSEQNYLYPDNENLVKQRLKEIKVKNMNKNVNRYRLWKKDPRIMTVPITTSKAIFAEVQRVHHWLATCWLHATK